MRSKSRGDVVVEQDFRFLSPLQSITFYFQVDPRLASRDLVAYLDFRDKEGESVTHISPLVYSEPKGSLYSYLRPYKTPISDSGMVEVPVEAELPISSVSVRVEWWTEDLRELDEEPVKRIFASGELPGGNTSVVAFASAVPNGVGEH